MKWKNDDKTYICMMKLKNDIFCIFWDFGGRGKYKSPNFSFIRPFRQLRNGFL